VSKWWANAVKSAGTEKRNSGTVFLRCGEQYLGRLAVVYILQCVKFVRHARFSLISKVHVSHIVWFLAYKRAD